MCAMNRSGLPPSRPIQRRALSALGLAVLVAGCNTVTTHKPSGEEMVMTQEEFGQYVEHVFRYHNQVMSDLIESNDALTEQTPRERVDLKTAERSMVAACQPLNEVVSESLSGEKVGLTLQLDLIDAVPACEAASKRVEGMIP